MAQANRLGPDQRADALAVFGATGDLAYEKSAWIRSMITLSTSLPQVRRQASGQYRIEVQEQIMSKQSEIKVKVRGVHLGCQGRVDAGEGDCGPHGAR